MDNIKTFSLVNNTFKVDDALHLILNLYAEKISFHNRQALNINECTGCSPSAIEEKISELRKTRDEISQLLLPQIGSDLLVEVSGDIQISFHTPKNG